MTPIHNESFIGLNMKSIVLLNFCDGMYGGIESFLLNAFYCLDKDKYEVTFLTCGRSTYDMFRDEIVANCGYVDEIPILANNYWNKYRVFKELRRYFRAKKPDIVHVNSGTLSLQYLASKAAKLEKIDRIILHSHNFRPNQKGIKESIKSPIKRLLIKNGDSFLACSNGAALWMFPKEIVDNGSVTVIPNGVDTRKFLYSIEKRNQFRNSLDFDDELLIGNIGRFQGQKNHQFMIKIMEKVIEKAPSAKLLLVGEGELKSEIQKIVNDNGLEENVRFLGERKDMDAFLSAIDIFILPSLYEGLPIASVEAQASGVKTLLAETITNEANVSGSSVYLPIVGDDAAEKWAEEILRGKAHQDRIFENRKVYDAGFDVHLCYQKMIDIYGEESRNVDN